MRTEPFYRSTRRRTGLLVTSEGEPPGGRWDFGPENRERARADLVFPRPLRFRPERITVEVPALVRNRFADRSGALEPFGVGNPRPVFAASPVDIVDGPRLLKERHLKLAVRQDGRTFRAIAWRAADRFAALEARRDRLALAFSLERDDYAGDSFVQLAVADLRPAELVG